MSAPNKRTGLALVGTAIGAYFGQPQLGFAAGSLAGGYLFPDPPLERQGPQLDDLRVTSSAYGVMRPITYGLISVGGNVIDGSQELIKTQHTESTGGGKGGGGASVETTTFTYSAHLAIGLGEGPITGVLQLTANEKLIYDVSPGAVVGRPEWLNIKVYLGTEDQEPDPTLESIHGAGQVSAYRGEAYIVLDSFQLADFGNRLPQFRVVVVNDGSLSNDEEIITDTLISSLGGLVRHPNTGLMFLAGGSDVDIVARAYNPFTRAAMFSMRKVVALDTPNECGFMSLRENIDGEIYSLGPNRHFYLGTGAKDSRHTISFWDAYTGAYIGRVKLNNIGTGANTALVPSNESTGEWYRLSGLRLYYAEFINSTLFDGSDLDADYVAWPQDALTEADWIWRSQTLTREATDRRGSVAIICHMTSLGEDYFVRVEDGRIEARTATGMTDFNSPVGCRIYYDSGRALYWVCGADATEINDTRLTAYDEGGSLIESYVVAPSWTLTKAGTYDAATGSLWFHSIWFGRLDQFHTATGDFSSWSGFETASSSSLADIAYHPPTDTAWGLVNHEDKISVMAPDRLSTDTTTLDDVVADVFTRAGLAAEDYDVTGLSAVTLRGYRIGRRATARAALDALRLAYLFDVVDTGSKLKCVLRGQASVATLDNEDLAAREDDGDAQPLIRVLARDALEVPQEVTVTYLNPEAYYAEGTQYARRQAGYTDNSRDVNLPMALSDTEAAQAADMIVRAGAIEAESYQFATHLGHLELEGADVITLQDGASEYQARIISVSVAGPILEIAAAREFDVYSSSVTGATGPTHDPAVAFGGPTLLQLLDIPLLNDADNNAGFYIAGSSYADGWPGCVVFRSDDNIVYETMLGIGQPVEFGYIQDAGADGPRYKWDETLTLTLIMTSGDVASVTEDQALSDFNAAAWGSNGRWELVIFQTATDNGDGTYTLSRLLRGLRGTGHAMALHQHGDRFILLAQSALARVAVNASDIGSPRYFKGVTVGDTLDASTSAQYLFTPQAVGLKPWAPVHIEITGFGGDITISWKRQDRIKAAPFQQPQMSEASESYEIDIMSGATVKRTLTAGTEIATYTSAQQTTDFGGLVSTLEINAYQISAVVGRGYAGNESV